MKTFYFTATGNSLYVAKRIGGELYSIPQMLENKRLEFEDEAIGIVLPCYGWGIPNMVIDFINRSKLKAKYFFAVMTYGAFVGGGLMHLEEVARKSGIMFSYTNNLLMIDNYLPGFSMEEQLKKEATKKIKENLDGIIADINNRKNNLKRRGRFITLFSKLLYKLFYNAGDEDRKFQIDNSCNSCKICEKVCPKHNIKVEEKPVFMHQCDVCYACIHHCPANAIHLKNEKSKARFINRHVELKEIIAANNRSS